MNFLSNIINKTKDAAGQAFNTAAETAKSINTDKIRWVAVDKIVINPKIKSIFDQGETEISNICEDMKMNGYNAGNPATLSQDNLLVEGHTRYLAAQRAGLKKNCSSLQAF